MLIEVDGIEAHAEDSWIGLAVRIGKAEVHFTGNVGRCLITTRDPRPAWATCRRWSSSARIEAA